MCVWSVCTRGSRHACLLGTLYLVPYTAFVSFYEAIPPNGSRISGMLEILARREYMNHSWSGKKWWDIRNCRIPFKLSARTVSTSQYLQETEPSLPKWFENWFLIFWDSKGKSENLEVLGNGRKDLQGACR